MTGGVAVILGLTGRNFAAGMSGGIAYIYDPTGVFPPKCNKEMVNLYKVVDNEDLVFLKNILTDFVAKTNSEVAQEILTNWPLSTYSFIKVLPNDYKRVLEEEAAAKESEKQLLKRALPEIEAPPSGGANENKENNIGDIEDSSKAYDKVKGFHKYERSTKQYRKAEERIKDWGEIFAHAEVKKTLKKQAARCMDCGVPFCQSKDGCPLGNIIPKWNDLVYQGNWKEALYQLMQTNNFPEFTGRVCPAPCEGACVVNTFFLFFFGISFVLLDCVEFFNFVFTSQSSA
jgi:glutamate synthase (NADPH/NADH)